MTVFWGGAIVESVVVFSPTRQTCCGTVAEMLRRRGTGCYECEDAFLRSCPRGPSCRKLPAALQWKKGGIQTLLGFSISRKSCESGIIVLRSLSGRRARNVSFIGLQAVYEGRRSKQITNRMRSLCLRNRARVRRSASVPCACNCCVRIPPASHAYCVPSRCTA